MSDPDPLVEELLRARGDRRSLVIAVVIGIVAGVVLGMASVVSAFGAAVSGPRDRPMATLLYFVTPVGVSVGVGALLMRARQRRGDRRGQGERRQRRGVGGSATVVP